MTDQAVLAAARLQVLPFAVTAVVQVAVRLQVLPFVATAAVQAVALQELQYVTAIQALKLVSQLQNVALQDHQAVAPDL